MKKILVALACTMALPAVGQLRLPPVPQAQSLPSVPVDRVDRGLNQLSSQRIDLRELRQRTVGELLRRAPDRLERDPAGELAVRSEVVAVSPTPADFT